MPVIVAIPVKPFSAAKQRLAEDFSPSIRRSLSVEMARRTALAVEAAGASPLILSADDQVSTWAQAAGYRVLVDKGSSLDEAAHAATDHAGNDPWIVCHADLPLLEPSDLESALGAIAEGSWVIAPSSDGGTSLIGGRGDLRFGFGPGSFQRHLGRISTQPQRILISVGTLLDLDTSADFEAAQGHPRGLWLRRYAPIGSPR